MSVAKEASTISNSAHAQAARTENGGPGRGLYHAGGVTSAFLDRSALHNLLAYGLIPNLPFVIAGHFLAVSRAYFDADYFFLGMLAPFVSTGFLYLAFGALFMLDLLRVIGGIFRFSMPELLLSAKDLAHVSPALVVPIVLGCVGFLVGEAVLVVKVSDRRRRLAVWELAGVALVLLLASRLAARTELLENPIAASVVAADLKEAETTLHPPAPSGGRIIIPAAAVQENLLGVPAQNIVLVVVESLGDSIDPDLTASVFAPFRTPALQARYDVRFGKVIFGGHTTEADLREICQSDETLLTAYPDDPRFAACLPAVARSRGYQVSSYHGFTKHMFDRDEWYPRLGFQHMYFEEELAGLPRCGGNFRGICDTAIARLIGEKLLKERKTRHFIYWLTLNSHIPVNEVPLSGNYRCDSLPELRTHVGLCRQMAVIYDTMAAVADEATARGLPPTTFLLVGDHAPPWPLLSVRNLFSQRYVPYVVLRPRTAPARRLPQTRLPLPKNGSSL